MKEIQDDVIIGLVETHAYDGMLENLCIPGFELFSYKNRPLNRKSKTSSGGLAFFIKESVKCLVSKAGNMNDDTLWLKFKGEDSGKDEDIFIGLVYISPSNSKNAKKK